MRKYSHIFRRPERFGDLYVLPNGGRGRTGVTIYVVPAEEPIDNLAFLIERITSAVKVYDEREGGWIYDGPWKRDFEIIFDERVISRESEVQRNHKMFEEAQIRDEEYRVDKLLKYRGTNEEARNVDKN